MATYIRWRLDRVIEEDAWCYAELDETRWVTRYVERRENNDDATFAAASLAEEMRLRDEEGLPALSAYHSEYGWTPEAAVEYRFREISVEQFEAIWRQARHACEAGLRAHRR
ncbi:hypothetical protein GCM10025331_84070 [Actinoplanes utahensis]|uniref:Uncharacterized protein n=2 Tax=Actinoplanes utahensis TaxID=1869 RepID=A0A0A6UH47_ACTUT|nr:hypothetical protein [Actinoplanes utahensis]KHD75345.1 hypothetical protein MB27_23155 [Actinoplanes utahensis]GIF33760.1 hypothetical protein Aut01nite_67460 [Actinoplanes utahensis]